MEKKRKNFSNLSFSPNEIKHIFANKNLEAWVERTTKEQMLPMQLGVVGVRGSGHPGKATRVRGIRGSGAS